ncbi:ABC transporter substrate-binding protein [Sneathiella limimaris]|uniref:ABC transporter substrate-binding protein n=1 Tax=Sneathiella limimaris TaxID=1964213 RepID=UPI00146EA35D|nr:ABC transporter substrate-binding protein [Sneathiella limimaris]
MKKTLVAGITLGISLLTASAFAKDEGAEKFQKAFLSGELEWQAILERAKEEGEVNWFHWGGSEQLNGWIAAKVAPELEKLGIELKTTRIAGTREAVDLVLSEKQTGRGLGEGSVDAIWLNGDNFLTLSKQDALFGSFAAKLPNSKYFFFDPADAASELNLSDFGTPTEAREMPWSGEQYVCYVETNRLSRQDAPSTFEELYVWLQKNPGRFTYVKPPHYIGNTFVQSVLYAFNPRGNGYQEFQRSIDSFSEDEFTKIVQPGFEYLKRLEPLLLGDGEPIYPQNQAANQTLFNNGEVDMGCEFGLYLVANMRKTGAFSETTETIIFPKSGMIKNKNFIAIPGNAPHPAAALVLANVLSSLELQISKLKEIGYPLGVDMGKLNFDEKTLVANAAPDHFGVTADELSKVAVPDTNASLVKVIQSIWIEYIERDSETPFPEIVRMSMEKAK